MRALALAALCVTLTLDATARQAGPAANTTSGSVPNAWVATFSGNNNSTVAYVVCAN